MKTKTRKHSTTSNKANANQTPQKKRRNRSVAGMRKTIVDRIVARAEATNDPQLSAQYDAIFGRGRPIDDLMATNLELLSRMRPSVLAALRAHLNNHEVPVFRQVTRLGSTPGSNAEISVPAIRKAARLYEQAKIDVIAAVHFIPEPNAADPHGVGFRLELRVLFFGEAADSKVYAKERSSRSRKKFKRSPVQKIDAGDRTALSEALKQIITPGYTGVPIEDLFLNFEVGSSWADDADRGLRALFTMMARAQLPLKSMLVLHGAGKSVFAHAITEAKRQLDAACKAGPFVIHRDGLVHFFFAELRRLGLHDVSVPLVMLR